MEAWVAAVALVQSLAWELLYAAEWPKKKKKKIHFASLCLLIGVFNPFMFNVIIEKVEFMLATLLFLYSLFFLLFITTFFCVNIDIF